MRAKADIGVSTLRFGFKEVKLRETHTGVVALVDEATGYEKIRPQNALREYLALMRPWLSGGRRPAFSAVSLRLHSYDVPQPEPNSKGASLHFQRDHQPSLMMERG